MSTEGEGALHQADRSIPGKAPLETLHAMPANAREILITPEEAFRVSMRLAYPHFVRIYLYLMLFCVLLLLWFNGVEVLQQPLVVFSALIVPSGVYALFAAAFFFFLRKKVRAYKQYGVPVIYGFDAEGLYSSSPTGEDFSRWERYTSWQEVNAMFLLSDGVVQFMLPKAVWTEDELAQLYAIFHDKIKSSSSAGGGSSR